MNLLLFIIILIISVVVVKLGAIAFELTGLTTLKPYFRPFHVLQEPGLLPRRQSW